MPRQSDENKTKTTTRDAQNTTTSLAKRPKDIAKPTSGLSFGTGVVLSEITWWDGSLCDIEVLINGNPTGIKYNDIVSHTVVAVGDNINWSKNKSGQVEVTSGSGATGTSTPGTGTGNVTNIVYNVFATD